MTTISQILEGYSDAYASTGTLNRILQENTNTDDNAIDFSDDEDFEEESNNSGIEENGDLKMKNASEELKQNDKCKKVRGSGPRLERVLEDDEFIPELRQKNELLQKYLTPERVEQMIDYLIIEPSFSDSPIRCFKLPFVVTEALIADNRCLTSIIFNNQDTKILDKLFSYIQQPVNPNQQLNSTLGGYLNKIVSFWLIKDTQNILAYIIKNKTAIINSLFNHMYLTQCVTDLLVRICTVRNIGTVPLQDYKSFRNEIIQHCINSLEYNHHDDFMTEQLFEILSGIVRKCYQMHNSKELFDFMLSPFILQPILDFAFSGGQSCRQGAEFLKLFLFNMFVAEPSEAIQDVMEINFGFQITSIAGLSTEEFSKLQDPKLNQDGTDSGQIPPVDYHPVETPVPQKKEEEKKKEEASNGEFETMKQEQNLKNALMLGAKKIYDKQADLNALIAQQIVSFFGKFQGLFQLQHLKLLNRVKLYELLQIMVLLDNEHINKGLIDKSFTDIIMEDYERYDRNSNLLSAINQVIIAISSQNQNQELKQKLFRDSQMLFRLAKRLSLSEYSQPQTIRKDIYPFISQLVLQLQKQQNLKKLLSECEPNWTALRKAVEDEQETLQRNWGESQLNGDTQMKPERKEDVIRRHEANTSTGMNLLDKGAASTTKKIVQTSVQSRKKMMMFDEVLK
eukprot:403365611